jgi:hypothetical protein
VNGAWWIGVDPGCRTTGIVARAGRGPDAECRYDQTITHDRPDTGHGVTPGYLRAVTAAIAAVHDRLAVDLIRDGVYESTSDAWRAIHVTAEDVNVPSGHARGGFAHPRDLIGLGVIVGYLTAELTPLLVPPNSHGKGLLAGYPPALVSDAERRRGLNRQAGESSSLRHVRSAWDVTLTAERQQVTVW